MTPFTKDKRFLIGRALHSTSGADLTTQNGFTNSAACATPNANFRVQMTNSNLLTLRPATYTGRITILITPE